MKMQLSTVPMTTWMIVLQGRSVKGAPCICMYADIRWVFNINYIPYIFLFASHMLIYQNNIRIFTLSLYMIQVIIFHKLPSPNTSIFMFDYLSESYVPYKNAFVVSDSLNYFPRTLVGGIPLSTLKKEMKNTDSGGSQQLRYSTTLALVVPYSWYLPSQPVVTTTAQATIKVNWLTEVVYHAHVR